tara:strand:+ start:1462 stop:1698 length:237 start_codon:yes stop_codon:yes gene_type:complete
MESSKSYIKDWFTGKKGDSGHQLYMELDNALLSQLNKDQYILNHAYQLKRLDGLNAAFYEQEVIEVEKLRVLINNELK